MKYTLLIILSLFTASLSGAVQADGAVRMQSDSLKKSELKGIRIPVQDEYNIQVGAFKKKTNAESLYQKLKNFVDVEAKIVIEDGLYKVRITRYPGEAGESPVGKTEGVSASDSAKHDTLKFISLRPDSVRQAVISQGSDNEKENPVISAGKILFLKGDSPWLKRIKYFGKSFSLVNALIVTILFSISSMIILLVIILANRTRMEKKEKLHQYLLEKYQGLIIDYLFGNTGIEPFREIASSNYRRQVLIDQMIDVSVNLKGEESKKLLELYKLLGLDRDSIERAYNFRWHKKIKGFRELAFMNIKDANGAMYKALDSSNELLRMEAQIALVSLSSDDPFEFLSHLKRPFSLWEQITLNDLIIQHELKKPEFKKWLRSTNDTVVMFALRMIREFKQGEAELDVRKTLLHPSPGVKQLAVEVAGDMAMKSTLDLMKRMYKKESYAVCLEIVRSMGKMPDLSMMGFLKLVLDKEEDVQLQIEASKAIENMGQEGLDTLNKLMSSEYKNYSIIIKHVLDRRIF
jgi:hypothetical protein